MPSPGIRPLCPVVARRVGLCQQRGTTSTAALAPAPWVSRALPEARGEIRTLPGRPRGALPGLDHRGLRRLSHLRLRRCAARAARSPAPPMPAIAPAIPEGARLFLEPEPGPVHGLPPGPGRRRVAGRATSGPDLSTYRRPRASDANLVQRSSTIRASLFRTTTMPPGGRRGSSTPRRSSTWSAFLADPEGAGARREGRRARPEDARPAPGLRRQPRPDQQPGGDAAEGAERSLDRARADAAGLRRLPRRRPAAAMKGVATRYPRHLAAYGRVMSHRGLPRGARAGDDGAPLPAESAAQSRHVDAGSRWRPTACRCASTSAPRRPRPRSPEARRRSTGAWASATTRAPTATRRRRARNKFLGGRLLADVEGGLTRHFPDLAHQPGRGVGPAQAHAVVHDAARDEHARPPTPSSTPSSSSTLPPSTKASP